MWIAHLSDPHVMPRGVLYNGVVDTNAALAAAVAAVNALDPLPDAVLLSGDVVETGDAPAYAQARSILNELRPPLFAIPGNHDERAQFRAAFRDHAHLPNSGPMHFVVDVGDLRIVACDVTIVGKHHGDFDEEVAEWLSTTLAIARNRPTLVMMHQPPLSCGIPYLDPYRCFGEERLANVISRFPAVERFLCGHVHRHMMQRFAGTLLCTAPSTATAIALRTKADATPASYLEPPGFLLHHWRDGRLLTHTIAIGDFAGPFPFV